jgi:hypothetical protein
VCHAPLRVYNGSGTKINQLKQINDYSLLYIKKFIL